MEDERNKVAYYFSHDSNAQEDPKCIKMRMKHGWEGYGIYWALVERLRDADGYKLTTEYAVLAYALRVDEEKIRSIVEDFDLFVVEDGEFYSDSLNRRMAPLDELREARREAGRLGGIKSGKVRARRAEKKQKRSKTEANEAGASICLKQNEATLKQTRSKTNLSKVDKIREDNNIDNIKEEKEKKEESGGVRGAETSSAPPSPRAKSKAFAPPTLDEVQAYCKERGNSVDPEAYIDFYSSKGWMIGKNKMKDWKAAVRTWERREPAQHKQQARLTGVGEYRNSQGQRTYGNGKYIVPEDAPPRPSSEYGWYPHENRWGIVP